MKYIALLLAGGGVYLVLAHHVPFAQPAASTPPPAAPGTDFLKEPLDRTHEVLRQARERTQDGALQ